MYRTRLYQGCEPTPRARRSSLPDVSRPVGGATDSACAEVFPTRSLRRLGSSDRLRVRGGLPAGRGRVAARYQPTPRARRSSPTSQYRPFVGTTDSACAEVFPRSPRSARGTRHRLRVRGGLPASIFSGFMPSSPTPRARRSSCNRIMRSLMVRDRLRVRGGLPWCWSKVSSRIAPTPRARRSSPRRGHRLPAVITDSACAEVFPAPTHRPTSRTHRLRVRGGLPPGDTQRSVAIAPTPRARRSSVEPDVGSPPL